VSFSAIFKYFSLHLATETTSAPLHLTRETSAVFKSIIFSYFHVFLAPPLQPFTAQQGLQVHPTISIFVLVELAWNNAGKRTGSSNHEKTT